MTSMSGSLGRRCGITAGAGGTGRDGGCSTMVDIPPRWWWLLFKRGSHVTPLLEGVLFLRKHRDPPPLPFLDWAALLSARQFELAEEVL